MPADALARALAAHQAGRLAEAEQVYRVILAAQPADFDALHMLGVLEYQRLNFENADRLISRALQINPRSAEALSNRGTVLSRQGRHAEALASYNSALAIRPAYAEARYNRANTLKDMNLYERALADYDAALSIRSDHPEAWNNRGIVLVALKRIEEALASYEKALALRPEYAEAWNNRGVLQREARMYEEALTSYARALAIRPAYPEALNNRGQVFDALGRYDEELSCYAQALAIRPDYAEAHTNEGLCRLLLGDYERGWKEYEWRWKTPNVGLAAREFERPQWHGREDLRSKSILLHMEQGLGDAIQACRYVPLLAARGAAVTLEAVEALAPLVNGLEGLSRLIIRGNPLPATDFHCPLLSLPLAFGTSLDNIPASIPYLSVDRKTASGWRGKLAKKGAKLVGLCWRGNPDYPRDRERSCNLDHLLPLLSVPGVRIVSLQKELTEEESKQTGALTQFVHPDADFRITAEAVAAMDLVISVDTSWAHWAGAIGKPVWVLLPFSSHWIWLTERTDSPWYPSARLFRQPKIGDWESVVQRVKEELAKWLDTV